MNPNALKRIKISLIGAGAIGSFTALSISKMGAVSITGYDDDGVAAHNLSNQFYRKEDLDKYKVDALSGILESFSDTQMKQVRRRFTARDTLEEVTIVATDSMPSRQLVWEKFKRQKSARILIEARMGAELGMVYTIKKVNGKLSKEDIAFYQPRVYPTQKIEPLPCTARSIIYNVLMISSLICRAFKGVMKKEKFPRELIFNMTSMDERSYMFTK
jgi:hypothetical protein